MPFPKLDPGSTIREDELLIAQAEIARYPDPYLWHGLGHLDPGSTVREGEFDLGKLGTEVVGYMPSGRPIISNPDGSYSTERTTTVKLPNGKWVNIPTMFDGKEVSVDQAFDIMRQHGFKDPETGIQVKEFKSEPEASKAAASGSKAKDRVLMEAIKRYKSERRNFPSMFDKSGRRIK